MDSISSHGARVRDRISELPDPLISHILSFLETVEAVRTSVLSTRWKKQWTHVPILDIIIEGEAFPVGIDRVLFFRDSSNIQKLRLFLLEVDDLDFARVDNWICTAIWRNVVELDLGVDQLGGPYMELPQSLFTCRTLKVLKLTSRFIVNPPTTGCFPSLKILYVLVYTDGRHDNSLLEKLFSNCPVLEDLTIDAELDDYKACDINISVPKLRMLKVSLYVYVYDEPNLDVYSVNINAPELVNFDIEIYYSTPILFQVNANSHFKANINLRLWEKQPHSRLAILDAISSVKHLSLSSECVFEVLPNFDNLTHLKLDAPFRMNCWAYLKEFLKRSPNLKHLIIEPVSCIPSLRHDVFNPPDSVPVCMLSHLKTITFKSFKGRQDEMGVAKYLLKYSEVLNKMTIKIASNSLLSAEVQALRKEVSMFDMASKTCQVEIS